MPRGDQVRYKWARLYLHVSDVVSTAHPAGKFCVEAGIKSWLVHAPDRIKQKEANNVEANDD